MILQLSKIVLTDRDIELFCYLNEQKFMVAGQIYQIFWPASDPESGTARQRLTKLVEAGYLKTMVVENEKKKMTLKLFLLTEKGIDVLRKIKLDHRFSELSDVNPVVVEHGLKLVNIRGLFRELGHTNWQSERLIRKEDSNHGWYPDAVLNLYGFKIAIELENSFRPKERYVQRFKLYENNREYRLALFVLCWKYVRSWLFDLEASQDRICFANYDDLLQKKGEAELTNATSSISLQSIL